ncbi:MAG: I78 family peptidase inhibitor [Parasphingorhabdus sp.]|uniref:I78 family peptidase inhibitor n=1 Tax=Parasphingorhabdus sp. TaxID=2709688 RepID=UPI003297AAE0
MKFQILSTASASAFLLACTTAASEPNIPERGVTDGYLCNSDGLKIMVGQEADDRLGEKALRQSGAKRLRWIPPNTMVTQDFRQDRLNIAYDDKMIVTRINCG